MTSPDSVPTIKIVGEKSAGNPEGSREINASDFDEKIHKLWVAVEKTAEEIEADAEAARLLQEAARIAAETLASEAAEAAKGEKKKVAGWGQAPPPGA